MSVRIMSLAWALEISSTDKLVMLALADWSNDDGVCWPSMAQLAKKSGLTDRAIRASVGRLVSAGHLTRDENPGKGVCYTVHPGTTFRPEQASPRNETSKTPERRSANTSVTTTPKKATPSRERAREAKPARMPDDWRPTKLDPETVSGAIVQRRGQDWARAALESFRNWAANANGPNAKKLNWQLAWANWVIEQDKRDGRRTVGVGRFGQPGDGLGATVRGGLEAVRILEQRAGH